MCECVSSMIIASGVCMYKLGEGYVRGCGFVCMCVGVWGVRLDEYVFYCANLYCAFSLITLFFFPFFLISMFVYYYQFKCL